MTSLYRSVSNLGRIAYYDLRWGLRVPQNLFYQFFVSSVVLVILGLVNGRPEYMETLVPGLVALGTASGALQGIGSAMAFLRARGTWRTIQASPIPSSSYFAGLVCSRMLRVSLTVGVVLLMAFVIFEYRFQGSLILNFIFVVLGVSVFGTLGIFISYLIAAPQAVSGALNIVFLIMVFSSNALFTTPYSWMKIVSAISPLTYLVALIRSNARGEGVGPEGWANLGVLLIWLAVCAFLTIWLSNRRVEEK